MYPAQASVTSSMAESEDRQQIIELVVNHFLAYIQLIWQVFTEYWLVKDALVDKANSGGTLLKVIADA